MSESGRRTISSSTSAEESEDPRPTERKQPRRKSQRKPAAESLKRKSAIPEGRSRAKGSTSIERPVPRTSDCASEVQAAGTGTGSEVETLRKLGEEIQEGVRRLGAARLKEYVLPRALEQAALVEKVLLRVEKLEEENRDMKSILQRLDNLEAAVKDLQKTSARPQPRGISAPVSTYAETVKKAINAAAAPTTSRAREGTVVISAPEGVTPEKIQEQLKKAVNPAEEGWQIVNRKVTGSSKLALNTATKEQAKALAEHPKLKEVGLRAEVVGRRRPRMVVYDIPMDRPDDEILEAIIAQNFGQEVERDSIKSQLRPVFKFSNRRAARDRNHWICEVSPELRKNLMERQRLFVDFNSCRVDDHLGITRCYKCQRIWAHG